jgi:Tol biopolymer transport system component
MKQLSLLAALLFLVSPALHAVPVVLQSKPAGATVRILNVEATAQKGKPAQWVTPATAEIQKNKSGESYTLEFSKDGFETVRVPLDLRAKLTGPVSVELPPLTWAKEVSLTSYPSGAYVSVGDSTAGQTPLKVRLQFTRPDSRTPWSTTELRFALPDHQTETATMTQDPARTSLEVELARLKDDVSVEVVASTTDGGAIERAHILVDGERKGDTPARVILPFHRAKKTDPWNEVRIAVGIPDEYQQVERTFSYPAPATARFELTPVTEMTVTRYFPTIRMTPRGPRIEIDQSQSIGTVDDRDEGTTSVRTVRLTTFERKQASLQAVNSFAVTPDGQSIVYAVTFQTEDGRFYSNLFLRSTNPSSASIVQLTRGPRFLDCYPAMSREEGSNLVVFQSNRGSVEAMDISSFRLQDGRLVGGVQQLTREARFNEHPSFTSEALPVFFSSLEQFPNAEPRLTSVRADGTAYTNLGEVGQMPNFSENGRIYFSRLAEDTKKYQLYSILADGTGIETVLTDYSFASFNCHSPSISPDGRRLLFVSDYNSEKDARTDSNIWMIDLTGSRQPFQLTTNRSEDLSPRWSPTEPDVIYFLSNRRGVFNVWQMAFKTVR